MRKRHPFSRILLRQKPDARACIHGDPDHPNLNGCVSFYQTRCGVLVAAEVWGLPDGARPCGSGVYGFHIHEGCSCTGNEKDPFADTGGHYNPCDCDHPKHAGDLPPLFGSCGCAWLAFFPNRFTIREILGRTVVIHAHPDDFHTQPAGDSGMKIGCGKICPCCHKNEKHL